MMLTTVRQDSTRAFLVDIEIDAEIGRTDEVENILPGGPITTISSVLTF